MLAHKQAKVDGRKAGRAAILGAIFVGLITLSLAFNAQAETVVHSSPDQRMAVVELYTSEGCSSCPPADKRLSQIGQQQNPNILPLAFHVDYWDYLGWKDEYSKAQYTDRQRRLGRINKQNTIYTPEFFVDGAESRRWRQAKIDKTSQSSPKANLVLSFDDGPDGDIQTTLKASDLTDDAKPEVFFAITESGLVREIGGGENGGRTLHHDHVVRVWSGPYKLQEDGVIQAIKIDPAWKRENLSIAAIVADARTGQTLQAVVSPL